MPSLGFESETSGSVLNARHCVVDKWDALAEYHGGFVNLVGLH